MKFKRRRYGHDLLGVGNCIVDIQFKVDDKFLKGNGIEKGTMQLIDEARLEELKKLTSGMEGKITPGGSAANSLVAFCLSGGKGSFYGCIGQDELGEAFSQSLKDSGVNYLPGGSKNGKMTGCSYVFITEDGTRSMNTYQGASSELDIDDIDTKILKSSRYIFVEGYLATQPKTLDFLLQLRARFRNPKRKFMFSLCDPSVPMHHLEATKEFMKRKVYLLFCNEEESRLFSQSQCISDAFRGIRKYARRTVITRGEKGAVFSRGKVLLNAPQYPAKVVDVTGAGDVYAGVFMYGIIHSWGWQNSAFLANFAAKECVETMGGRISKESIKKAFRGLAP